MEALKYLAWHLIYACDEMELYKKLASEEMYDCNNFVQWINHCLRNGKSMQTVLTQKHLDEISRFLTKSDMHQWKEAYCDFAYYALLFGNEKVSAKLDNLGDFKSEYCDY